MGMYNAGKYCTLKFIYIIPRQCNGMDISWDHLLELYTKNRAQADDTGLAVIPKLKYEHVHLTSYSKMRVDLAAQVRMIGVICFYEHGFNHQCISVNLYVHAGSQQLCFQRPYNFFRI